jgi:hypothetical protein
MIVPHQVAGHELVHFARRETQEPNCMRSVGPTCGSAYVLVLRMFGVHGSVVVEALCYKPEGHGFEARRGELFFSSWLRLSAAVSNRNEYQK